MSAMVKNGVARRLTHHHQDMVDFLLGLIVSLVFYIKAVLGFLLGLFVSLVLYTTVSGQFGSTKSIVVLQSMSGEGTEQNARTSPPLVSSAHNNSIQVHDIENGQKDEVGKTMGKEGSKDKGTIVNDDDAAHKMKRELIQQELDQDGDGNDGGTVKHGSLRRSICDLTDPRYDICEISGDARALGVNHTVLYVPPANERDTNAPEWAIKDQSRKHLGDIKEVNVKILNAAQSLVAPECTSRPSCSP
ncbi:hypothetical protein ZWY2020_051906 [Hordeum vulgare]|nr:hypothetical protein ZWY2020_051906 [Hordeum vulgare]